MTLLEAAKAVVRWGAEFRAFLKGEYGVEISAADEEDHNVSNLFSAIDALRAAIEAAEIDQSYMTDCAERMATWDREQLEVQYMNAVEAVWILGKELAKERDRRTIPAPPEVK